MIAIERYPPADAMPKQMCLGLFIMSQLLMWLQWASRATIPFQLIIHGLKIFFSTVAAKKSVGSSDTWSKQIVAEVTAAYEKSWPISGKIAVPMLHTFV